MLLISSPRTLPMLMLSSIKDLLILISVSEHPLSKQLETMSHQLIPSNTNNLRIFSPQWLLQHTKSSSRTRILVRMPWKYSPISLMQSLNSYVNISRASTMEFMLSSLKRKSTKVLRESVLKPFWFWLKDLLSFSNLI